MSVLTLSAPAGRTSEPANAPYSGFDGQYIGGQWRPGSSAASLADHDPYTGKTIAEISLASAAAPKLACRDLKKRGYRIPWPAGVPTITPLRVRHDQLGATDCRARFVIHADGTVWSVSPLRDIAEAPGRILAAEA